MRFTVAVDITVSFLEEYSATKEQPASNGIIIDRSRHTEIVCLLEKRK